MINLELNIIKPAIPDPVIGIIKLLNLLKKKLMNLGKSYSLNYSQNADNLKFAPLSLQYYDCNTYK